MRKLPSLADIVGPVDFNSAVVLSIIAITLCIIITTAIGKRRSRRDLDHEFELAKIKQADAHAEVMFGKETARAIEQSKLTQNLITSHRETNAPQTGD